VQTILFEPEIYTTQPRDIFPGTVAEHFDDPQQGLMAYWVIVYLQESNLTWLPMSITDLEQLPEQFQSLTTAGYLVQQPDQRYYFTKEFVDRCAGRS